MIKQKEFKINKKFKCDGSGIWDDTNGVEILAETATLTVEFEDGEVLSSQMTLEHDSDVFIYTDKGIEKALSEETGIRVTFSEQGMQDEYWAHFDVEEDDDVLVKLFGVEL